MKQFLVIGLLAIVSACGQPEGSTLPTGLYGRSDSNEFGKLRQSLKVTKTAGASTFNVVETTHSIKRKLDDTVWLPEKTKTVNYVARFDESEKTLELEPGLVLSFDPAKGTLSTGAVTFTKQ
jgi:hypothetical protein